MHGTVYVNGDYVPAQEARISVFDRGFLFADGVYEVCAVLDGKLIDNPAHLARLERSMSELDMPAPIDLATIPNIQKELANRNDLREGMIYLQISRGPAERDFGYPQHPQPSLVMFCQAKALRDSPIAKQGMRVVTVPDLRWKRRDIKTVGLLAASMAKQHALNQGVHDAWMVEDGHVTEGTSNNAYIINHQNQLITRHLSHAILAGVTRAAILEFAKKTDLSIVERPFTVAEAKAAREAFITSASTLVCPVIEIDGVPVAEGKTGVLTAELRRLYLDLCDKS